MEYLIGLGVLAIGLPVVFSFMAVYAENNSYNGTKAPKVCHWIFNITIAAITIPLLLLLPCIIGASFTGKL